MPERSHQASLVIVFLTVLIDLLGFGLLMPLMAVYAKELTQGYSPGQTALILSVLMTVFSAMQLIFQPVWGRLSDRVGRRPILLMSLASSTFFYGLFGVATLWGSLTWMFVARLGGGIAAATISTAQAYIADVTPPEQRTRGMALIGVAFGLGFTFGPLLGALALLSSSNAHLSPWPGFTAAALSGTACLLATFRLRESLNPRWATEACSHFDWASLRQALAIPSVSPLLATLFLSNFSFAAFESTLSLSLATFLGIERGGYQILLAFAYIGLVQSLVQGGLVRWLANRLSEGLLGSIGVGLAILGYLGLAVAANPQSGGAWPLMVAASVVVAGLGFIYPSVNALISRRSDPAKQGGILGVGEGLNSLARITGVFLAMTLYAVSPSIPFWVASGLMGLVFLLVLLAVQEGHDWEAVARD